MRMSKVLKLGSLFDGSGGFPLGGLLSGINPVWASEIEPFPIMVTSKRLPQMKYLGDISKINGAEIEPVDIITFGSPCTDMSVAGKRAGLGGSQSVLFYQAIRIIKEMRKETNGKYPRYIVWENVTGAFSSNKGKDFKAVLDAIISIVEQGTEVPMPDKNKWAYADCYVGNGWSIAYRTLNAQYWGVPQRRRRIYLVADFAGGSAWKVLFKSDGLSRYSKESFSSWQEVTKTLGNSTNSAIKLCLNDQGGNRMDVTEGIASTLRAKSHHPPCIVENAAVFENHSQDTRFTEVKDIAPTVVSKYGTGGNNQPIIVRNERCFDLRFTSMGTKNKRANAYETETARTIDTRCNHPNSNQGGIAVVSRQEAVSNEHGDDTADCHNNNAVAYGIDRSAFNQGKNAKYDFSIEEEKQPTIVAKGPGAVAEPYSFYPQMKSESVNLTENCSTTLVNGTNPGFQNGVIQTNYAVRRLTPVECARLQGFPDWWCSELAIDNPTAEDIEKWSQIFETHRKIIGKSNKPKTTNQIVKWLKNPYSDSAAYKMWGNGVALPNVFFVLAGIEYYYQKELSEGAKKCSRF